MQVGEGIEPVHQSLCMNPAQRMASHCELSGIVTQHHGVAQEVVRVDAAPDGPLSSNLHGIWRRGQSGEAKSVEVCRPGGMISKKTASAGPANRAMRGAGSAWLRI